MNPIYVPLLSALAGALIGSLSSIVVMLIHKCERHRLSDSFPPLIHFGLKTLSYR